MSDDKLARRRSCGDQRALQRSALEVEASSCEDDFEDTESGTLLQESSEDDELPARSLEPHTFDLLVCALVHHTHYLACGRGSHFAQVLKISVSLFLLSGCIIVQILIMSQTKYYVTDKAERNMRIAYDIFEQVLYDGHTYIISEGPVLQRRGIGGSDGIFFNVSNFGKLTEDQKSAACNLPLAQAHFLAIIMFIWTLTCFVDLRKTTHLFRSVVLNTERCESMRDAFIHVHQDKIIARLTPGVKCALTCVVLVPRLFVTTILTWLGSRWLLTVPNLDELLLNALALEFILVFKELLYVTLASARTMVDLDRTKILPPHAEHHGDIMSSIGPILWAIAAMLWVMLFTGVGFHRFAFQQVLHEYQWDAHLPCGMWLHNLHYS